MTLIELRADFPPEQVETIDAQLQEVGLVDWNIVEDVIEKTAAVVGLFPTKEEATLAWAELVKLCPLFALTKPSFRPLAEQEWRDSYKAHFKAWQFGQLHWVPLWEKDDFVLPKGHEVLWLDPGLAFGTGNHETTRLCVERLVEYRASHSTKACSVIDAGCGSGILALSAAKLGFQNVIGFDNDPEAVRVSEENAALNGLEGRVEFFTGDLVSGLTGRRAELVFANILAPVLIEFAPQLVGAVAPEGTLILSGILASEGEEVRAAFRRVAPTWSFPESRILGEWCDVVCHRNQ